MKAALRPNLEVGLELMTQCQRQECYPRLADPHKMEAFKTLPMTAPVVAFCVFSSPFPSVPDFPVKNGFYF